MYTSIYPDAGCCDFCASLSHIMSTAILITAGTAILRAKLYNLSLDLVSGSSLMEYVRKQQEERLAGAIGLGDTVC